MQQATQTLSKPAYPNMNPDMKMKGDSALDAMSIEKQALNLQASLGSGSLGITRATLRQLRQLSGLVGRLGTKSAQVQGTISGAIAKAQRKVEQMEQEEGGRGDDANAQEKFQIAIYGFMSAGAKKFYDNINENASFDLAVVNDDGELDPTHKKHIDGKTLKRLVSIIKFHSLDTASKKKVLYDTFGSDVAEEEGTPKDKAVLAKKKKELLELHEALENMEAYKAYMITHKYRADVAAAMIEKNHKAMMLAHEQIDEVARKYDELMLDVDNGMAMATLKVAKLKMKKMLKEDIIEQTLLDQAPTAQTISGGVNASGTMPVFAAFGSMPSGFIQQPAN